MLMPAAPTQATAAPQRLPTWAAHWGNLVAARLEQPFAWGSNDCVAFVADALQAMHGRDTMAEFRTQRSGQKQAWLQLREGGGLKAGLARAGLLPVAPSQAQVGDVVLLALGPRQRKRVLAVCNGDVALSPGRSGLMATPMALALMAWRS